MDKELIITYFKEFKYWLTGGELLFKPEDKQTWFDTLRTEIDWSVKGTYVINDSYSIYRIALAEGKIVQEQDYFNKQWLDMKTDDFHGASDTRYEGVYRVKPERHKFKTGDWVIHNGVVKRVTKAVDGYIDSLDNEVAVIMKEESLELWEPKDGEWCIMYDMGEDPDADSVTLQKWDGKRKWTPIPFIGKLPPYIKK